MHSLLVDGEGRGRKLGIGEGTDWDDDCVVDACQGVEDRGPAFRAEPERALGSLISESNVLRAGSRDLYGVRREASLGAEDTSGSSLAGKAVAHRDTERLGCHPSVKLATTARGDSDCHELIEGESCDA